MQKIRAGSFFVLGFEGLEAPPSLQRIARRYDLGGATLLSRNVAEAAQVRQLNEELHRVESGQRPLVAVDQEGGRVRRLRPPEFGDFPAAREVGVDGALDMGRAMGRELRDLGFDLDYAPVLDVDTNPENPVIGDRAFSDDPEVVARAGAAFATGLHEQGIFACGKHFPGHGDTSTDSHHELPRLDHERDRLDEVELAPFRHLTSEGLRFLMTAHVVYEALDPIRPATFSHPILVNLLREKMGWAAKIGEGRS